MQKICLLILFIIGFASFSKSTIAQTSDQAMSEIEDETQLGGDIFSDFNEDLESAQVLEDERFYRYGRFFSVNLGAGITTFTGNRGRAYDDNPPTFHLSTQYFMDFQRSITIGIEYSKHTAIYDYVANGFPTNSHLGAVVTDFLRPFVGYKYYMDTADLGTAITYSNPYLIGRLEYWYQTNTFLDQKSFEKQKGGGIGTGYGFGLEFPVEIKKSYVGVEFLYHIVNFFDKYTADYRKSSKDATSSSGGYKDLTGNVISIIVSYNFTW